MKDLKKKDIENVADIKLLIDRFYEQVKQDDTIGYIFNDVARVNWEEHLPTMYSFWSTTLLGVGSYDSNPMEKHILLSKKTPLTSAHFERWLQLWTATIDSNFYGRKAEEAKSRGRSIADLMLLKISQRI